MASKKGISPHSQIYLDLIKVKESSTIKPHNLLNYKDQTLPRMQTPTSSSSATATRSASEDEAVKRPANMEKIRLREAKDKLRLFVHQDLVEEDMPLCFAEGKCGGDSKNKKKSKEVETIIRKHNLANKILLNITKLDEFRPYLQDFKTPIEQLDGAFEKVTFYANAGAEVLEDAGMTNVDGNLLHRKLWHCLLGRRQYKVKDE